jgi:hypothetical protein
VAIHHASNQMVVSRLNSMTRYSPIVVLVTLLFAGTSALAQDSELDAILAVRDLSNKALADHDIDRLEGTWLPNLHVTASNGEVIPSGEEMRRLFSESFSDPDFITYTRTPDEVSLSPGKRYAAERGHWIGRWRNEGGEKSVEGIYLAQWHRTESGWRIRSELFVALSCVGSDDCQDLP